MTSLQRPEYLKNRAPFFTTDDILKNSRAAKPPRISLKDDRFTLMMPDGNIHPTIEPSLTLKVAFVGKNPHKSREYYDTPYDASATSFVAPACFSDNGIGPSVSASKPQSDTCAACPNAVWGSKINQSGHKISACSTVRKMAVLVLGAGETVFLLKIPPGSLSVFEDFIKYLRVLPGAPGTELCEVVVRLSMTNKTLKFEFDGFLTQQAYDFAQKVSSSDEAAEATGVKDRARQGALPAPSHIEAALQIAQQAPRESFGVPAALMPPDKPDLLGDLPAPKTRAKRGSKGRTTETHIGPGVIDESIFSQPPAQSTTSGFIGGATPSGFGMAPASAPSKDLDDALARAFNQPLGD